MCANKKKKGKTQKFQKPFKFQFESEEFIAHSTYINSNEWEILKWMSIPLMINWILRKFTGVKFLSIWKLSLVKAS